MGLRYIDVEAGRHLGKPADGIHGLRNLSSVDSLVSAPKDPDIAYMAYERQIFRSTNRGESWTPTSFGMHKVRWNPMEKAARRRAPGRRSSEQRHRLLWFHRDGLWVTTDAGTSWGKVSAIPAGRFRGG